MQLVEENFEFEFRGAHHIKNLASKVPLTATIPTLQLVNLARKTLDSAKEEEVELWRRNLNPEMMSSEEQSASALADSPTSRFTAVNGEKPTSAGPSRRGSDERSNGQPRISPPGQEKLTITTSTPHREDWPNSERPSYQPPYSEAGSQQKRKRSGSPEHNQSSANSYDAHVQPSSAKETSTTAMIVESDKPREDNLQGLSQMRSEPRSYMHPESEYRGYINSPSADESWPRHYASQHLSPEDNNLEEALRRASQTMDSHQRQEYDPDSPGDADRSANPYSAHGYEKREMSAGSDPKKRKRNFSNRTKTGCMTCRKRKKKCDEKRPECINCLRGGFICSGYQQRGAWTKPEQKPAPIALQSKTEYEGAGYAQSSSYNPNMGPRRELPSYRGQTLRVDPPHGRPINTDDEQPSASTMPSASTSSPDISRLSAVSFGQQVPTPITASSSSPYPDRDRKSTFERVGPLNDKSRLVDADAITPLSALPSNLPHLLHPQITMTPDSPHPNPQDTARLALSSLPAASSRPVRQKDKMLAGEPYYPYDKELVLERERCNGACWRFNNSNNHLMGVSPEERSRLFRDILQPRESASSPMSARPASPVGRVGSKVVVEAPFNCDYGYNIVIGTDVAIGRNCTILDTVEVKIGDRCNIGPNVNIYAATLSTDPKVRMGGTSGPKFGKRVIIESDCWIGGNVTILPGVLIGRGSTVGAGSVVERNVPPSTVVSGNPAIVQHGVYNDSIFDGTPA